ncbi:MAG TPA: hypothetical protein VN957_21780, partial [Chthoniobacterales bacterium]|nr:hypothetical protein [Chthoniobacterales bacterium]
MPFFLGGTFRSGEVRRNANLSPACRLQQMVSSPAMFRQGLAVGVESGESSASEDTIKAPASEQAVHRFEHYELVMGEDGKPVELGRGAMGITYKAFDVDLHCPVTLKV